MRVPLNAVGLAVEELAARSDLVADEDTRTLLDIASFQVRMRARSACDFVTAVSTCR
jgi:hypothetical protein